MIAVAQTTLDPAEVEKFSKLAAEWWNPKGKFGVLHVFNPVRLAYIKEQVCARFARDPFVPSLCSRRASCSKRESSPVRDHYPAGELGRLQQPEEVFLGPAALGEDHRLFLHLNVGAP